MIKTPKEVGDAIKARQAELAELVQKHNQMVQQFEAARVANQARANHIEGIIEGLTSLLPKKSKAGK